MALPQFQPTTDGLNLSFNQLQNTWAAQLNPILANPVSKGIILKDIALISGANTINHLLGRKQQGWIVVDTNAASTLYRSQPLNNLTLTLTASAPATVSLLVY